MREPEPYDHLFKLLLIGDAGVGKSRYVEGEEAEGERGMGWRMLNVVVRGGVVLMRGEDDGERAG
jgi:hypothetical protein